MGVDAATSRSCRCPARIARVLGGNGFGRVAAAADGHPPHGDGDAPAAAASPSASAGSAADPTTRAAATATAPAPAPAPAAAAAPAAEPAASRSRTAVSAAGLTGSTAASSSISCRKRSSGAGSGGGVENAPAEGEPYVARAGCSRRVAGHRPRYGAPAERHADARTSSEQAGAAEPHRRPTIASGGARQSRTVAARRRACSRRPRRRRRIGCLRTDRGCAEGRGRTRRDPVGAPRAGDLRAAPLRPRVGSVPGAREDRRHARAHARLDRAGRRRGAGDRRRDVRLVVPAVAGSTRSVANRSAGLRESPEKPRPMEDS